MLNAYTSALKPSIKHNKEQIQHATSFLLVCFTFYFFIFFTLCLLLLLCMQYVRLHDYHYYDADCLEPRYGFSCTMMHQRACLSTLIASMDLNLFWPIFTANWCYLQLPVTVRNQLQCKRAQSVSAPPNPVNDANECNLSMQHAIQNDAPQWFSMSSRCYSL